MKFIKSSFVAQLIYILIQCKQFITLHMKEQSKEISCSDASLSKNIPHCLQIPSIYQIQILQVLRNLMLK